MANSKAGSDPRETAQQPSPQDEPALRAAITDAAAAVRRYLFGMCGRWELAEDLAQEALLKAWSRRDSFGGRCDVRTWIFTIARNHWLDALRKKRLARTQDGSAMEQVADNLPPVHHSLAHAEMAAALAKAVAGLPEEQREALALRESEGLTFNQIAELTNVPAATVKSRVRYALLKLADELAAFRGGIA